VIVGSLLLILVAVGLLVTGVLSGSNALIICSIVVVALAAIVLVIGVRQSAAAVELDDDEPDADDLTSEYPIVSDSGFRVRQADGRRRADRHLRDVSDTDESLAVPVGATSRRAARSAAATGASAEPVSAAMGATTADHGPMIVDEQTTSRGFPSQGTVEQERYATGFEAPAVETPSYPTQLIETGFSESDFAESGFSEPGFGGPAFSEPAFSEPGLSTGAAEIDADDDDFDEDPPDEPSAQMVSAASAARVAMLSTDVLVVDGRPRYHVPGCVHLLSRETEPIPVGEAVELGFTPCGLCEPDSALLADARRV
jgi:hypothetical protein